MKYALPCDSLFHMVIHPKKSAGCTSPADFLSYLFKTLHIFCFFWYKIGTNHHFSAWQRGSKPLILLAFYLSSVFIVGKSSTSRIAALSVRSMHIRSIPKPMPPVGGMPTISAFMKSSSVVFASSSPCARSSSCALKRSS